MKSNIPKPDLKNLKKEHPRDEENRIVIHMNVRDDSNFLSVFSSNDTPVVSDDVAQFLESSTHSIPVKESLTLRIKSDCVDEQEQTVYKTAIKEYYTERYAAAAKEIRRCNILALCLAVLGVLVLALAVFLDYQMGSVIWAEVIDIVAWVFLWEAVDVHFFKTRELRLQMKRYAAFVDMKIEYVA